MLSLTTLTGAGALASAPASVLSQHIALGSVYYSSYLAPPHVAVKYGSSGTSVAKLPLQHID